MDDKVNSKLWFVDDDGSVRFMDVKMKTLYMPFNIEPEDYSSKILDLINGGWVVQLELI